MPDEEFKMLVLDRLYETLRTSPVWFNLVNVLLHALPGGGIGFQCPDCKQLHKMETPDLIFRCPQSMRHFLLSMEEPAETKPKRSRKPR